METTIVAGEPGGIGTLVRAALPSLPVVNRLPGVRRTGDFHGLAFTRPAVTVEAARVAAYREVCGFRPGDDVPLPYLHLLAFGLHMSILTDPSFPFAPVGAVHLANTITRHRPVDAGETVTVTCRAEEVRPHPKGRTVDILTAVDAGGRVVWESSSTYLGRGRGDTGASVDPGPDVVVPGRVSWRLPADLGRRYAAVSGDHNPIHLYPLTAKALGFPRQIAHGMCTLARCVAALRDLPDAVTLEAAFKKPVVLPATVAFGQDAGPGGGIAFALTSPGTGSPHVIGRTRPA